MSVMERVPELGGGDYGMENVRKDLLGTSVMDDEWGCELDGLTCDGLSGNCQPKRIDGHDLNFLTGFPAYLHWGTIGLHQQRTKLHACKNIWEEASVAFGVTEPPSKSQFPVFPTTSLRKVHHLRLHLPSVRATLQSVEYLSIKDLPPPFVDSELFPEVLKSSALF